ncbi:MAG: aminoacyl-tRNA hydrolase [Chloroflexota bacterium]
MQNAISFIKNLLSGDHKMNYLIAGLGNPGKEYANNRHNIGFLVVDKIAEIVGEKFSRVEKRALVAKGEYKGSKLILAKPTTYMNLSGEPIGALVKFYNLEPQNILIIYDELDLPFDSIRVKPSGGSAGHKGMKSIINHLGTQDFARIRVGIGRPPGKKSAPKHVLQNFSKEQQKELPFVISDAADAALHFMENGVDDAMNKYNKRGE